MFYKNLYFNMKKVNPNITICFMLVITTFDYNIWPSSRSWQTKNIYCIIKEYKRVKIKGIDFKHKNFIIKYNGKILTQ